VIPAAWALAVEITKQQQVQLAALCWQSMLAQVGDVLEHVQECFTLVCVTCSISMVVVCLLLFSSSCSCGSYTCLCWLWCRLQCLWRHDLDRSYMVVVDMAVVLVVVVVVHLIFGAAAAKII